MKLINKKAFYLIFAAIITHWSVQILNVIIAVADSPSAKGTLIIIFGLVALIEIGLSSIFFFKLLAHRKQPKEGTYLTVLLVFACIIGGINLIRFLNGNVGSWYNVILFLILFAVIGLIIAGYVVQRKTPVTQMPQYAAPNQYPYGQPPYGQPTYGNPNQPQNPYGQPNNPYYQQPNPYVPPYSQPTPNTPPAPHEQQNNNPQANPYNTQPNQPQSPYANPYTNPYATYNPPDNDNDKK